MIGEEISHYRITAKLGQGGMGEVYLAEDTHLRREVALKFLPEDLASNSEILARFMREARVLASLSHPNLAVVHGLESTDGRQFIVMERVEGQDLAIRLARGRMKLTEALRICEQIAAGLESAHEQNIVHRDLKPANVMVSPDGKVKILDFGLARAQQSGSTGNDGSDTVAMTTAMTRPGTILGTAPYMSPEQVTGRRVDRRTDVWAFGCVLFECLTGKRAFSGPTLTELVAGILERDPDWDALPTTTPATIRSLLHRCLAKDPAQRQRDIGDARIEIVECLEQPADVIAPHRRVRSLRITALAIVILVGGGWIGNLVASRGGRGPIARLVSSTIEIEPGHCLDGMRFRVALYRPTRTAVAMANDASFIVYSAALNDSLDHGTPSRLYLRRLDRSEADPIDGTEGGIAPLLSPDDRWVGFWAGGQLRKVPLAGGAATVLCDASWPDRASWGSDGSIAFHDAETGGLSRVAQDGGPVETLTTPDPQRGENSHRLPSWLPGGEAIVFTVMRRGLDVEPSVALLHTATGEWRSLIADAADARYVPTGHLVFLRRGTVMAVRFDLDGLRLVGHPVAVIENVSQALEARHSYYHTGAGQYAFSRTGWLVYATGGVGAELQNQLVWVDQFGRARPAADKTTGFLSVRLSPDGRRTAFQMRQRVWVLDLESGALSPLTPDGEQFVGPIWSHEGSRLIFCDQRNFLYWQPWDASRPMEPLTDPQAQGFPTSVSSNGHFLALLVPHSDTGLDIAVLDLESGAVTPFVTEPAMQSHAEFSPDGRLLAYASEETGSGEVFVQPFPDREWKRRVSAEGGTEPLWSRDGKRLFYRSGGQVWSAEVRPDGAITLGKARLLFETADVQHNVPSRGWDVSLDSEEFLMTIMEARKVRPLTKLVLLQNWGAELERLLPAGASQRSSR